MSRMLYMKDIIALPTRDVALQLVNKVASYGSTENERHFRPSRAQEIKHIILSPYEKRSFDIIIGHVPLPEIARRFNAPTVGESLPLVGESTNVKEVLHMLTAEEWIQFIDSKRVDGQHTCHVILHLTDEEWQKVRFPIIIDWEEWICDTTKDRAYLFESINTSWSARSKQDRLSAHLGSHDELYTKLSPYLAAKVLSGLSWYMKKVERNPNMAEQQQEMLYANHDIQPFLVWFGQTAEQGVTRHLFNSPVIAAMYHTTRGGNEKTQQFWKEIARGYSSHPNTSMAHKLSLFLSNLRIHGYNWKADLKRNQLRQSQLKPNDSDVFGTCLRVLSAVNNDSVVDDIFAPSERKSPDKIAQFIYPLAESPKAA